MTDSKQDTPRTVKLLLVDDHAVVRLGIMQALELHDEIQIIGTASTGEEAIAFVQKNKPDVVLMDYMMPGMTGVQATPHLLEIDSGIRILIFSGNDDKRYAAEALDAGAYGFISKSGEMDELALAICQVADGDHYLEPDMAKQLTVTSESSACFQALSDQELEVAMLLASGETTSGVMETLNLDADEVHDIRSRLLRKLGLRNSVELAHFMLHRGEL